jgi:ABC-type Fe3+/spermidine/putrescine transport system ATPase subunit
MRDGHVVQSGTPSHLVRSPADSFVASFLELGAVVKAVTVLPAPRAQMLLVRPEAVSLVPRKGAARIRAGILSRAPHPQGTLVRLALRGGDGQSPEMEILCGGEDARLAARCAAGECSVWVDGTKCTPLAR